MIQTFDRYSQFIQDGHVDIVPFAKIQPRKTDYFEVYRRGQTRLDLLSYDYYESADYGWLIMQANPEYGSIEFRIPDGAMLRIPYPLEEALESYRESVNKYKKLNR